MYSRAINGLFLHNSTTREHENNITVSIRTIRAREKISFLLFCIRALLLNTIAIQ